MIKKYFIKCKKSYAFEKWLTTHLVVSKLETQINMISISNKYKTQVSSIESKSSKEKLFFLPLFILSTDTKKKK